MIVPKISNEMVDRWIDLSNDLPQEELSNRIVDEFSAEFPEATVFDVIETSIAADRRVREEAERHAARDAAFKKVTDVLGTAEEPVFVVSTLTKRALGGDIPAAAALLDLMKVTPVFGPEWDDFIQAAKQ